MKKSKRLLSLVLSMLMILSCISVSFIAFAGDGKTAAVTNLEEKINEFINLKVDGKSANLAAAKPVITVPPTDDKYAAQKAAVDAYEQALALYNEICPAFKALTENEKDSVDIYDALRFLQKSVMKEAYEIKTAFDADLPAGSAAADKMTAKEAREKGYAKTESLIGTHQARTDALELTKILRTPLYVNPANGMETYVSTYLDYTKYPQGKQVIEEFTAAYKAASPLARAYADGVDVSGSMNAHVFTMASIGAKLRDLVKMTVKMQIELKEVVFGMTPVTKPTKPNVKNFAGGVTDPAYVAAINEYLPKVKAYQEYLAAEKNWKADLNEAALTNIANGTSDIKVISDTAVALREGFADFNTTNSLSKAEKAIESYEKLNDYQKKVLSTYTVEGYSFVYLSSKGDDYSKTDVTVNQLYDKCVDARNIIYVEQFEEYIASVDLSKVDNDVVAEALAEFNKIPASVRSNISTEIREKYDAIIALYDPIDPLTPSDYDFAGEIKEHNNNLTEAILPDSKYATEEGVNKAMDSIESLIYGLIGTNKEDGLQSMLEDGVYTNATIGKIFSLYNTINNSEIYADILGSSTNVAPMIGAECTPKAVAGLLGDDARFAKAKAKLLATIGEDEKSSTADYAEIIWESGDWGFDDGDENGFKDAFTAALRPVMKMLDSGISVVSGLLKLPNYYANNGDYCYGAYELLLPAFEAIGLSMPTSEEYTSAYNEAIATKTYNDALDTLIRPLVDGLFNVIDELAKAPLDTLVKYLPQIGYAVDSGILNDSVKAALATSGILNGLAGSLDLSGDGLNAMLTKAPVSVAVDETTTLTVQLLSIDWAELSGCATAYKTDSVLAAYAYRMGLKSDVVPTFATVFYYLYDTIFEDSNYSSLKNTLIKAKPLAAPAVLAVTETLKGLGKVDSLGFLLDLLAGDGSLDPDTEDNTDSTTEPSDDNNGHNDVQDDTRNPDIPKTGSVKAAVSALAVLGFAAASYVITSKKRRN